ncbi:hypothetical protein G6321_00008920 [Bradyrhizobium barranii subsp. barranii]|uniref:Uncharacterized protein n=1 Tax=Bradyrhizobium barranii subsp. barranii TaxID=2823807 RepID=A0A7Z0Q8I7_9BRAD|nr:hypothetical protein [Bradyrhizobium barranii]UGX95252.1 hypothetical protein G6321_00008920 [Bradyrhizobium barranii subsp. barranii]
MVALGAVAALDRSAAPVASAAIAPEVVIFPVPSGTKGDRLLAAKKEDVALAVPAATIIDPKPTPEAVVSTPAPQTKTKPKEPAFIPRHWHDNAASSYTIRKRSAAEAKVAPRTVEQPKQSCSQDGLRPLLRKLNLQPNCEL